jgi:hypothetical protein
VDAVGGPWEARGWAAEGTLGRGGGGTVHAVRHRATGALGALKTARDPEGAARLRAEAEVLGRVFHRNLIALLDHGDADGVAWIVTARHPESAAAQLGSGAPMAVAEARRLGAEVLDALAALHAAGVVHRDVKPSNVLRAADGRWILADLGSARTPDGALTLTGTVIGTPAYMAPEQRYGARHVGPAADLYALGATLWALLRGETPFELHAADARAWRGIRPDLARVLQRATRLDPAERWSSAAEMRDALASEAAPGGRFAPRPSSGARTWSRRAALLASAAGGLMLALLTDAPRTPVASEAVLLRVGGEPDARLGAGLATGVDLIGRLDDDVAVGAPGAGVGGRVEVFADGCCTESAFFSVSGIFGIGFGERLAPVRRSSTDAEGGLLIGAPHASSVILGPPPPMRGQAFFKPDARAPRGFSLEQAYDHAFAEVGSAVDVWHHPSGAPLLAFGAPGAGRSAGAAIAMFGAALHALVLEAQEPAARLGEAVALADLDGDGAPELLAGAPGAQGGAGCVYTVVPEDRSAVVSISVQETGALLCGEPGDALGAALVRAGDGDGDGADEVWVGAPGGEGRALRVGQRGVIAEVRGAAPGGGFGTVVQARPDAPDALCVGAPSRATVWCFDDVASGDHDAGEAARVLHGGTRDGAFGAAIGMWRDTDRGEAVLVGAPDEADGAGRLWGFAEPRR